MLRAVAFVPFLFSLILPANAIASPPPLTISPPSGPIGQQVAIGGNLSGSQWASTTIYILFNTSAVSSAVTNSSGQFTTRFFVPLLESGIYSITIKSGSNIYDPSLTFRVTFGTDTLVQMYSTVAAINTSLTKLSASFTLSQNTIDTLQAQLKSLDSSLTIIRSLIRNIASNVTSAQVPSFGTLNTEVNNVNESILNLGKQITELNATLSASKGDLSRQEQVNLLSIVATIGVGAVLLIVIQFGTRRKKRPGIDNWELFD